jgi:hypothetical protein
MYVDTNLHEAERTPEIKYFNPHLKRYL